MEEDSKNEPDTGNLIYEILQVIEADYGPYLAECFQRIACGLVHVYGHAEVCKLIHYSTLARRHGVEAEMNDLILQALAGESSFYSALDASYDLIQEAVGRGI